MGRHPHVSRVLGFTKSDENNVQRAIALGTLNNILNNKRDSINFSKTQI